MLMHKPSQKARAVRIGMLFLIGVSLPLPSHAQSSLYTNLVVAGAGQSVSLNVTTGYLARIISVNGLNGNANLSISVAGVTSFNYSSLNYVAAATAATQGPPAVAGPATITLTAFTGGAAFCTIELVSPSLAFTPSTAVVIPADSGGPVNIILESSVDLITWNAALPGTYGTSTTNRFFRVRAARQ
jgi:hypothetical protein